jgi:hypothetical protein
MNKQDTEWQEAEKAVDTRYPDAAIETRLKLINMYFVGKSDGLAYARKILNEK